MSDGPVKHRDCGGRLDVNVGDNGWPTGGFTCRRCGRQWDGKEKDVSEYVPESELEAHER